MSLSSNALKMFAELDLDSSGYDKGLEESVGKAKGFGSALSKGLKVVAGVTAAAFSASAIAVKNLATNAVESYAQFEQLEGGIKKLYGNMGMSLAEYASANGKTVDEVRDQWQSLENAQNLVIQNASNAYKTSGMSMNQYMETATSFSAAMIKSLDGNVEEAARITDIAMQAMSDNVNTFGTDMESVQNAFMGLSRQNYMMIDNLKLGYAGTAQGMLELINDSGVLGRTLTKTSELADVGFSDMVLAIQEVQKQQNIAGTTAREAMTTIEGSANATKAAWQNVITSIGIGDGEGTKKAFEGLINSIFGESEGEGLLNQLIPRIQTVLEGIGGLILRAAPFITKKIPELFNQIVPVFVNVAWDAVSTIAGALPSTFSTLADFLFTEGMNLLHTLSEGVQEGIPTLLEQALPMLLSFTEGLRANFGTLVDAGLELILSLAQGLVNALPTLIEYVPQIVTNIAGLINDNAPKLITTAGELLLMLGKGIIDNIPVIIENAGAIVEAIWSVITAMNWLDLGSKILEGIGNGFSGMKSWFSGIVEQFKTDAMDLFTSWGETWSNVGKNLIEGLVNGFLALKDFAVENIKSIGTSILDGFKSLFGINSPSTVMEEQGNYMIDGLINGLVAMPEQIAGILSGALNQIISWGSSVISQARSTASNFLNTVISNITSLPARMWTLLGQSLNRVAEWGMNLASRGRNAIQTMITAITSAASSIPTKMAEIGGNIVRGVWNGIQNAKSWFTSQVKGFFSGIVDGVKGALGIHSPSKVFAEIGRYMAEGLGVGWDEAYSGVKTDILNSMNGYNVTGGSLISGAGNNMSGGITQIVNITSPEPLSPWETARQTKNATREMLLSIKRA